MDDEEGTVFTFKGIDKYLIKIMFLFLWITVIISLWKYIILG